MTDTRSPGAAKPDLRSFGGGPISLNAVTQAEAAWRAAGLDESIGATITEHLARHRAISKNGKRTGDALNARRHVDAQRIADGECTFESLIDAAAPAIPGTHADEYLRTVMHKAREIVLGQLYRFITELRPVATVLAPADAQIIDEARKLAPIVEGIETDEEAIAGTPKQRAAWHDLRVLHDRRDHLRTVYRHRALGQRPSEWWAPEHPDRMPNPLKVNLRTLHPVRRLTAVLDAGPFVVVDEDPDKPKRPAPKDTPTKTVDGPFGKVVVDA